MITTFHLIPILILLTSDHTLDAPDILDDCCLNLLGWGNGNVLVIALGTTVYLWDTSNGSTSELVTVDEDKGLVTSVNWASDGRHTTVSLKSSEVQLWDSTANRQMLEDAKVFVRVLTPLTLLND